jgi:glycosyltransferase involved in cell wall biosynthesis
MKVNVIGTRGFPYIQGGVEKHCESLYPLIAEKGLEVTVFRRRPYIDKQDELNVFQKVKFRDLWTVRNKNLEAIIHSFAASIICLYHRPDIIHVHNIGPSLVLPLLKLGGIKTVVTYHSPNYEHSKWSWFAKKMLKIGENFVTRWADNVIFVSKTQEKLIGCKNKTYIPNGVSISPPASLSDFLFKIGTDPARYILAVARFVPEKGLHDLIKAFKAMNSDYKLVIAGDADHETNYSKSLRRMAGDDPRIILTGYITGEPLNQVYTHARLFVLPSYHEGLPIALLEALSYALPVLSSDIPANKEVGLPNERYFRCGDVDHLKERMENLLEKGLSEEERHKIQNQIETKYNWEKIADQTIEVYEKIINA